MPVLEGDAPPRQRPKPSRVTFRSDPEALPVRAHVARPVPTMPTRGRRARGRPTAPGKTQGQYKHDSPHGSTKTDVAPVQVNGRVSDDVLEIDSAGGTCETARPATCGDRVLAAAAYLGTVGVEFGFELVGRR